MKINVAFLVVSGALFPSGTLVVAVGNLLFRTDNPDQLRSGKLNVRTKNGSMRPRLQFKAVHH
jgi:hypothetical protein